MEGGRVKAVANVIYMWIDGAYVWLHVKASQRQMTVWRAIRNAHVALRRVIIQVAHVEPHIAHTVHVDGMLRRVRQR